MGRESFVVTPRRFTYAAVTALLAALLMGGIAIQYANYVDRKSNHRWCGVVSILDDAYKRQPPGTEAGRALAREMARLRAEFDC